MPPGGAETKFFCNSDVCLFFRTLERTVLLFLLFENSFLLSLLTEKAESYGLSLTGAIQMLKNSIIFGAKNRGQKFVLSGPELIQTVKKFYTF